MSEKIKTRLYVDSPLSAGGSLRLEGAQAHYLLHILRTREGERVALFNGRDGEWSAAVTAVQKKRLELQVRHLRAPQKNPPDIWLAFAPVKNEKIDYTVKRAVELGASALYPVLTRRTVVSRVNLERLRANAVEAAEQSGRMDVPPVHAPVALEKLLSDWPPARLLLYGDESGGGQPVRSLFPALSPSPCGVLIGPEGGFTPEERALLARLSFARGLSLGPRILRAETAALAALAHAQAWLGDGNEPPAFQAEGA